MPAITRAELGKRLRRRVGEDVARLRRLTGWQRVLLVAALVMHSSLVISWRTGWWNAYTFDSVVTRGWRGWDFFALYQAGHNATTGISVYESDNDKMEVVAPRHTPYRYLPLPALTVGRALALLPPLWALRFWVLVVEVILLVCAYASWRRARVPARGAMAAGMWLAFTPYYLELYLGQFTLIQAALLLATMWSADESKPVREGVAWTVSLIWKQNTGLLAPVYVRCKRWWLLILSGAMVVLVSAPYFMATSGSLMSFLGNFRSGATAHQLGNLGLRQWIYSLTTWLAPGWSAQAHERAQLAWLVLVLIGCLWLTWQSEKGAVLVCMALWMTAYFAIYHHVWEHHYVLLLPILVTLYLESGSRALIVIWAFIALWTPYRLLDPTGLAAWHAPMRWTPIEPRLVDALYHGCKAAPTLALMVYIARRILQRSPDGSGSPC